MKSLVSTGARCVAPVAAIAAVLVSSSASANIRITEVMSSSSGLGAPTPDWIEITNADGRMVTHKQRREVELHANAMVSGTYNGYFKGGHEAAQAPAQPVPGAPAPPAPPVAPVAPSPAGSRSTTTGAAAVDGPSLATSSS